MKTKTQIRTKRGYDFYEVASVLQKSIRRADEKTAGYFALELFASGYWFYLWKRLLTISAEDVYDLITDEVYSLFQSFLYINSKEKDVQKGRVFISKAVIALCRARKCRDADHMGILVYDKKAGVSDAELGKYLDEVAGDGFSAPLPEYALDVHTIAGKMLGKTRADFMRDELEALKPRQIGLFDDLVPK